MRVALKYMLQVAWTAAFLCSIVTAQTAEGCQFAASQRSVYNYRTQDAGAVWIDLPCADGTRWNQTMCECVADGVCPNMRSQEGSQTDYQLYDSHNDVWLNKSCGDKHVDLIWSRTLCQCIWRTNFHINLPEPDPMKCETMSDITFSGLPVQDRTGQWIEVEQPVGVTLVNDFDTREKVCIHINDAPLKLWGYNANDMSQAFRIYVRFRVDPGIDDDFYQVVVSNAGKLTPPTLSLSYNAREQRYKLRYDTLNGSQGEIACQYVAGPGYDWKVVNVLFQDNRVFLFINGKLCDYPKEVDLQQSIPFRDEMIIGGWPTLPQETTFKGRMDEFVVVRRCSSILPAYLQQLPIL